ncbi:MAG TPA: hypothetical protein VFL55_19130, partial [Acetobacteraceae bacterium]|nr:hypothetical protein [Acetobacteraceae bacterium]
MRTLLSQNAAATPGNPAAPDFLTALEQLLTTTATLDAALAGRVDTTATSKPATTTIQQSPAMLELPTTAAIDTPGVASDGEALPSAQLPQVPAFPVGMPLPVATAAVTPAKPAGTNAATGVHEAAPPRHGVARHGAPLQGPAADVPLPATQVVTLPAATPESSGEPVLSRSAAPPIRPPLSLGPDSGKPPPPAIPLEPAAG